MIGLTPPLLQTLRYLKEATSLYLDTAGLVQAFTWIDLVGLQQHLPSVG